MLTSAFESDLVFFHVRFYQCAMVYVVEIILETLADRLIERKVVRR